MTRKMRIAVSFEVEVSETYLAQYGNTLPNGHHPLLDDIAIYLTYILDREDNNEVGEYYRLQDTTVYWPDQYVQDWVDQKLETSPDQPEGTMQSVELPATECPTCGMNTECPCCGWTPGTMPQTDPGEPCHGCGFVDGIDPNVIKE